MDLSRHCILLNGEPRTLQIDTIEKMGRMDILCVLKIVANAIPMAMTKLLG